jgi:hypothetical protein
MDPGNRLVDPCDRHVGPGNSLMERPVAGLREHTRFMAACFAQLRVREQLVARRDEFVGESSVDHAGRAGYHAGSESGLPASFCYMDCLKWDSGARLARECECLRLAFPSTQPRLFNPDSPTTVATTRQTLCKHMAQLMRNRESSSVVTTGEESSRLSEPLRGRAGSQAR